MADEAANDDRDKHRFGNNHPPKPPTTAQAAREPVRSGLRRGRQWRLMFVVAGLGVSSVVAVAAGDVGAYPSTNTFEVQVTGQAGVPDNAEAVVLNVTATNTAAAGFVTVWPCGSAMPDVSNLNFVAHRDVPNLVVSRVGSGGKVCLKASADTNLIVDVSGFFPAGASFQPSDSPRRILDTRSGPGGALPPIAADSTVTLPVGGLWGVPADAEAVVMNVTAAATRAYGYVTVFPCDRPRPDASNLNFVAGQDVPGLVIARLAADGSVCLYTAGATHLIADVTGYFPAGSDYLPADNPTRVLDTRIGLGASGPVTANSVVALQVAGVGGVPSDAEAVVLNATAADPAAAGFATVFPCGQARPDVSNLNFAAGQNIANLVVVRLGAGGRVCLYADTATQLIADVSGFFAAGSSYVAVETPARIFDSRTIPAPIPTTATTPPPTTPPPTQPVLYPGTTLIGSGAAAGRYIAGNAAMGCYWERLSGLGGTFDEIIANDFRTFASRIIVDIAPTDVAFSLTAECGTFVPYQISAAPTGKIPPGDWVVGSEIAPGTYRTVVAPGCYWERASSFDGTVESIIDNDFITTAGTEFVTISPSDVGFKNDGNCDTWTRIG
jgi:hypothetical protein